jgi:hypothetical protein
MMEREELWKPVAPFLGDGRTSRVEGDRSDKLGETVNFLGKKSQGVGVERYFSSWKGAKAG